MSGSSSGAAAAAAQRPLSALPSVLRRRLEAFAAAQSVAAPGAVSSIIVTGSATTGDWWPGVSDIDAVFLITRPLAPAEIPALADLHARTVPDRPIDGIHLTPARLDAGPDAVPSAMQSVEGELRADDPGDQLTWITWREVETGFETGVGPDGLQPWQRSSRRFPGADAGARAFCRRNLREYWAPLADTVRTRLADRPDGDDVPSTSLQWIALGPARLAATVDSGQILSKTAAAARAAERWPAHADLLDRAVAARSGAGITFSVADARSALRLLDECVAAHPDPR